MLKFAVFYKDELAKIIKEEVVPRRMLDRYRYISTIPYHDFTKFTIHDTTWNVLQMVSMDGGNIVGYIAAVFDRNVNSVSEVIAINFRESSVTFSGDLMRFLSNVLFEHYNVNKVNFSVVCGSPMEKMYDREVERYGGRIVGVFKDHVRLADGRLYSQKFYETMRSDKKEKIWNRKHLKNI